VVVDGHRGGGAEKSDVMELNLPLPAPGEPTAFDTV
jgi:hypothetical protein